MAAIINDSLQRIDLTGKSPEYSFAALHWECFQTVASIEAFFKDPRAWFKQNDNALRTDYEILCKIHEGDSLTDEEQTYLDRSSVLSQYAPSLKPSTCSLSSVFKRIFGFCSRRKPPVQEEALPKAPPAPPPPPAPPAAPKAPTPPPTPPAPPAPPPPPAEPVPTRILFPALPWVDNNCFLAALVWTYLLNDPVMQERIEAAPGEFPQRLRELIALGNERPPREDAIRQKLIEIRHIVHPQRGAGDVNGTWNQIIELIPSRREDTVLTTVRREREKTPRSRTEIPHTEIPHDVRNAIALKLSEDRQLTTMIQNYFDDRDFIECKEGNIVLTQTRFKTIPERLQFHIGRTELQVSVKVPFRLDLKTLVLDRRDPLIYELRGAILYRGNGFGGHYLTLLRRYNEKGEMENVLCDNHPMNRSQVTLLSEDQARALVQQGTCQLLYLPISA